MAGNPEVADPHSWISPHICVLILCLSFHPRRRNDIIAVNRGCARYMYIPARNGSGRRIQTPQLTVWATAAWHLWQEGSKPRDEQGQQMSAKAFDGNMQRRRGDADLAFRNAERRSEMPVYRAWQGPDTLAMEWKLVVDFVCSF